VYSATSTGGDIRASYNYDEYLSHLWKYTLSQTHVGDVQTGASIYIQEEAGTTTLSSIGQTLLYDRRDSRIKPTSGYYLRFGTEFAGVGGTEEFVKTSAGAGQYFKLSREGDWVLSLSTQANIINGYGGREIRINERFFLGGDTMRGFKIAGISPRDFQSGDALGGTWDATATAEVRVPLGLPKEFGVQGLLFADMGTVGQTDNSATLSTPKGDFIQQSSSPRAAIGAGVIWQSPMGPINIDLGYPVMRQSYDKIQIFRLNFGQRF
jgi:outer membrane protein insertion porin family